MKQFLLTLLSILAIGFTAEAQRNSGVRSGFKTGVNLASLNTDSDLDRMLDDRIGYQATFFMEFPITRVIAFQPELQYSAQGAKQEEFRANFINLPLTLKLNFTDFFSVHLGGQAGVKIWEFENNEDFDTFDYSALGGLAINLNESLFIEGRYVYGFANLIDAESNSFGINEDVTSSYIQLSIGVRL